MMLSGKSFSYLLLLELFSMNQNDAYFVSSYNSRMEFELSHLKLQSETLIPELTPRVTGSL